ncbi:hypothetical protein [Streptomyces sp. c-19]|uniref:hypothetical protein n=1 Tax=Streptomyces sp. c-19 TaxID=2789275 RepID=UPI003980F184
MTFDRVFLLLLVAGPLLWFGLFPLRPQSKVLSGPHPALWRAILLAGLGFWRPGARLMEEAGQDWERRALYSQRLARAGGWWWPLWVRAWERARPGDPDVALVRAAAQVGHAWRLRGAYAASMTPDVRFRWFHAALCRAREDVAKAALLNPGDPTPHVLEIRIALGLGYPRDVMRELWGELVARAPHHFDAHYSALQYWSRKWRGTDKLAREFARTAAADAPAGSLLAALPLFAWYETTMHDDYAYLHCTSPQVRSMVAAAVEDMEQAEGHPALPRVQHLVAHCLHEQGRHREALRYFRAVDGWVDGVPWRYRPLAKFAYRGARTAAVRAVVAERLRRRPPVGTPAP